MVRRPSDPVAPTARGGIGRRRFLSRGLALGCSLAASPVLTPITLAAVPGEARLVVIILRGGMDGLDVIRPVGDPAYADLRPGLSAAPIGAALDDFFALHPRLSGLMPLWRAGSFGAVQAVSTPYRDRRSHFDGQDLLEAGTGTDLPPARRRDGWLNRSVHLLAAAGRPVGARTAFAIGRDRPLILRGDGPTAVWTPDAALELSPQSRLLLERLYAADPPFRAAAAAALDLADALAGGAEAVADPDEDNAATVAPVRTPPGDGTEAIAAFVAEQLLAETRIAAFSLGGWDTHRNQEAALQGALGRLQATLLTLHAGLGPVWERTAVLAMTEFGRTARENGTAGTDHGTGGVLLLAGGALRGGRVHGRWPGLGESRLYEGRDLMPTRDVRAHAGWVLHGLFGLPLSAVAREVFPGLDLDEDPRLLAG